jgi:thioesterase domain-containing protein
MAASYLKMIKAHQSDGPYYLLGWSLGGALAMEIAYQLETAGEKIAFLGLIDSYVPGFATDNTINNEITDVTFLSSVRDNFQKFGISKKIGEELITFNSDVFIYLSELADAWDAKPLRVRPYCWWSSDDQQENLDSHVAQGYLEQAIGHSVNHMGRLPLSHSEIIRTPEVLDDVMRILRGT